MDRSRWVTRKLRRHELRDDGAVIGGSPAERLAMMWQLARDAWAFLGLRDEPALRRDVGRVVRGGR